MKTAFSIWKTNRKLYEAILENHTLPELNTIPSGLTTNIIWNAAHVIASQQKLLYTLSGLPMCISNSFFESYQNGSIPSANTTETEIAIIKQLLNATVLQTLEDFELGHFKEFQPYQTKTGFFLGSFEEAVSFNNYHEGIHLGMVLQIRKWIQ